MYSGEQYSQGNTGSNSANSYKEFDPAAYLAEYYSSLGSENQMLLEFYHEVYSQLPGELEILEFGGGPTLYQLASASAKARSITFAEYLPQNRRAVKLWRDMRSRHDWSEFFMMTAALEGHHNSALIEQRLRAKLAEIIPCDAKDPTLKLEPLQRFDLVSSAFCLECIGNSWKEFEQAVERICDRVRPGGHLVISALENAQDYVVGSALFPAVPVKTEHLLELLARYQLSPILSRRQSAEHQQGYTGIISVLARRDT
jgi:hypothetical protein